MVVVKYLNVAIWRLLDIKKLSQPSTVVGVDGLDFMNPSD